MMCDFALEPEDKQESSNFNLLFNLCLNFLECETGRRFDRGSSTIPAI